MDLASFLVLHPNEIYAALAQRSVVTPPVTIHHNVTHRRKNTVTCRWHGRLGSNLRSLATLNFERHWSYRPVGGLLARVLSTLSPCFKARKVCTKTQCRLPLYSESCRTRRSFLVVRPCSKVLGHDELTPAYVDPAAGTYRYEKSSPIFIYLSVSILV